MLTIINRITWIISFLLGYVATGFFASLFYYTGLSHLRFWVIVFLMFIFKRVLFSKAFIETNLGVIKKDDPENRVSLENKESIIDNNQEKEQVADNKTMAEEIQENKVLASDVSVEEEYNRIKSSLSSLVESPVIDSQDSDNVEKEEYIEDIKNENKEEESFQREPNFISQFFAENALAKIGGILLFLGVLFLLQLVYTVIGPIGKLIIGFMIGISLFSFGAFIDSKGYHKEARIVIGTSILINYLVILSGRYLIEESSYAGKTILNEGVTFFFLIVNTLFAIIASIAYRSNALLFFAFVISYLNPFLIGSKDVYTPYSLLGYSIVISFGSIILAYFLSKKKLNQAIILTHIAFVGGGILTLFAPFTNNLEWIAKLVALTIVSLMAFLFIYKQKKYKVLPLYFGVLYVFFFILLQVGGVVLSGGFRDIDIFLSYSLFVAFALGSSVYLFLYTSLISVFYVLFAPLLVFIFIIYSGMLSVDNITSLLILITFLYIGIFSIVFDRVSAILKSILFLSIGFFIVFVNLLLGNISRNLSFNEISLSHIMAIIISTYVFCLTAYYFSTKKNFEALYSIGTLFGIFMVLPVISREGEFRVMSMIGISGLIIFNLVLPLINKNLLKSNIQNLVFGVLIGAIFTSSQIFYFMFGERGDSQVTLGLIYLGLAFVYFIIGFKMFLRYLHNKKDEKYIYQENDINVFYTYAATSLSIFSLAVYFVFSSSPAVVSVVWLLEASILYFFYNRTKNLKIYYFAFVLTVVGLIKSLAYIMYIKPEDYTMLVPTAFLFVSLVLSLKFFESEKRNLRIAHDVAHFAGIVMVAVSLVNILPTIPGYYTLGISLFLLILFFVYSRISSYMAKYVLLLILFYAMLYQIANLGEFYYLLENKNLDHLKILQHLTTVILAIGIISFNYLRKRFPEINKAESNYYFILNIVSSFYFFVITTQFVYYLVDKNIFAISIYWGVLAFVFLQRGIHLNIVKYRTLGLYILTLSVGKIVINDIWSGLDNAVMRIVALMFVGGVMISVSMLYSKKYENQMKGEFSLDNIIDINKTKISEIIDKK